MTSFIPCPVFAAVSQASLRHQFQYTDSYKPLYINHTRHWNVASCTTLHPHSLMTVRTQDRTRQIRNAPHISFFFLFCSTQYLPKVRQHSLRRESMPSRATIRYKTPFGGWRRTDFTHSAFTVTKRKRKKKRRHIWSHLVHQITTSSMEQDSSQLLTQIAFADAISATQLWSCTARPESNKDEIWCSALGSPLMRGEGKLSEKHKTHPTSCLLALAGISSVRRARGWGW